MTTTPASDDTTNSSTFSFAHITAQLAVLNNEETCRHFPSTPLLKVCRELTKLTSLMGPALYFAAKDINSKLGIIEYHLAQAQAQTNQLPHTTLGFPLRLLMISEIERQAHINTTPETPTLCRTFARIVWFLEFVTVLLTKLTDDSAAAQSLQQVASYAYEQALAAHHTPLVRTAVRIALLTACPSRAVLMERIEQQQQHADAAAAAADAPTETLRLFTSQLHAPLALMQTFSFTHSLSALS